MFVALAVPAAAQVPAVVLLQNVKEHVDFVARYGGYEELSPGERFPKCKGCANEFPVRRGEDASPTAQT